jgi:hypothetical protein
MVRRAILLFTAIFLLPVSFLPAQLFKGRRHIRKDVCTYGYVNAPFWHDIGNFNDYVVSELRPDGPAGLKGDVERKGNSVTLELTFDDNSYQYVGSSPVFSAGGKLMELGEEWIGIDALLEKIGNQMLLDAVSPSTVDALNIDNLQCLIGPMSFGLEMRILIDDYQMGLEAKGMVYEGELKSYHPLTDTLVIPVEYNGRDTVATVIRGGTLNNFELSCLKAFTIQEKARYAIGLQNGEVEIDPSAAQEGRCGPLSVTWDTPKLIANHPYMDAFMTTSVILKFSDIGTLFGREGSSGR